MAQNAADPRTPIARILRRCGFGPRPGQVEEWVEQGPEALVESLLDPGPGAFGTDEPLPPALELGDGDDFDAEVRAIGLMAARMAGGADPLAERMTWYWHTHLTSSADRADAAMMWHQHLLVREHALGHFPTLVRAITTDAAMLYYLDGADSRGGDPNENYARELLELFTLGRGGGYGEADVRAAARILAGWWVDWETGEVGFDADSAYRRPVTFMGERRRWTLDDFIEYVCAQPACAEHVATRLWRHLVGGEPGRSQVSQLAKVFTDHDLQIRPLVAAILASPEFMAADAGRVRQPLEWLLAFRAAAGFVDPLDDNAAWWLELLGQTPWYPPNVAGWPLDDRWASASQMIARTSIVLDQSLPEPTWDQVAPTVDAVLARCAIYDPSPTTRAALDTIERDISEYDGRLELLFATAAVSPEFCVL